MWTVEIAQRTPSSLFRGGLFLTARLIVCGLISILCHIQILSKFRIIMYDFGVHVSMRVLGICFVWLFSN